MKFIPSAVLILCLFLSACAPLVPQATPTPQATMTLTPLPTSTPSPAPSATPAATGTPSPSSTPNWHLVWSDEFNGPKIDPSNWGYEIGYIRNGEYQYYTDRPENARIENGQLVIEARRTTDPAMPYTSASLISQGKRQFQYGRFEMRAKIPTPSGSWPAWWSMGINKDWPACGEIDMMEYYKQILLANVAFPFMGEIAWDSEKKLITEFPADWSDQYHVWVMEWDADTIRLYVDDQLMNTFLVKSADDGAYNPFRQPHYMIINLAIGGSSGGDPSVTDFPLRYSVDYVRVYQK